MTTDTRPSAPDNVSPAGSPRLQRMFERRRSEAEYRAEREKTCTRCKGRGRLMENTVYGRNLYPCPVCQPPQEKDRSDAE